MPIGLQDQFPRTRHIAMDTRALCKAGAGVVVALLEVLLVSVTSDRDVPSLCDGWDDLEIR